MLFFVCLLLVSALFDKTLGFETATAKTKAKGPAKATKSPDLDKNNGASESSSFPEVTVSVGLAGPNGAEPDSFVQLPWLETSGPIRALGYPESASDWPMALFDDATNGGDTQLLVRVQTAAGGASLLSSISLAWFADSVHIPVIVLHSLSTGGGSGGGGGGSRVFHVDVRADTRSTSHHRAQHGIKNQGDLGQHDQASYEPLPAAELKQLVKRRRGYAKIFFRVEHSAKGLRGPVVYREPKKPQPKGPDGEPVPPPPPPQSFFQRYWHLILLGLAMWILSGQSDSGNAAPSNEGNSNSGGSNSSGGAPAQTQ